jgi:hypothetical protein
MVRNSAAKAVTPFNYTIRPRKVAIIASLANMGTQTIIPASTALNIANLATTTTQLIHLYATYVNQVLF